MKNINEFKEEIIKKLEEKYEDYKFHDEKVNKANLGILEGILVMKKTESIGMIFYIDDFFNDNKDVQYVIEQIERKMNIDKQQKTIDNIVDKMLNNFQEFEDKIYIKIIPIENNEEYAEKYIYEKLLNLFYAIPYIELKDGFDELGGGEIGSINITQNMIEEFKLNENHIWEKAKENMLNNYITESLTVKMMKMINNPNNMYDVEPENDEGLIILSRNNYLNGAGYLCCDNVLNQIKNELKSNFYILPSSINEILLLKIDEKNDNAEDVEELNKIIKEVNTTQVLPEELLYDKALKFDGELKVA